jgi:hypothetical protein
MADAADTAPAQEEENVEYANAMAENWAKKGANSYYYAHKNTNTTAPRSYGDGPSLLHTSSAPAKPATPAREVKTITQYSWADGSKTVKVYVELPGLDDVEVDDITTSSTDKSARLVVPLAGSDHVLDLPKLYDSIKGCSVKKKTGNRLVFVLQKETEFTWYELKK